MGAELAIAALAVLIAMAAASALLLRLGLGRQIGTFEAIDGTIADFERGAWRSAAAGAETPPADAGIAELRRLLDEAEASYRTAGKALAAARGEPQ